jgi:hypothetical protein
VRERERERERERDFSDDEGEEAAWLLGMAGGGWRRSQW